MSRLPSTTNAFPLIGASKMKINKKKQTLSRACCRTYWLIHYSSLIIRPFTLYLVYLSFAAHGRNVQERNYECRHVSRSLFSKIWNPYSRPAHMTIWLGDLNYRLEGINAHPARNLIDQDLHHVINSSPK